MTEGLRGRRAIVAGGAGFIGGHLVRRLLDEGAYVLVLDNFCTGLWTNLPGHTDPIWESRLNVIPYDVTRSGPQLFLLLADTWGPNPRADYLVNLASPASPPVYDRLWKETMAVNSQGVQNLADLALETGATFLQASTSEVYGEPHQVPTAESDPGRVDPTSPRSVYDEGKRFAETLLYAYHRKQGLPLRVARIFNTYGPRMRLDDGRVVTEFVKALRTGQPYPIFGDGQQTRSLCYVSDLVEGLVRLLLSDFPYPVNLGNPYELTVTRLAEAVHAAGVGLGLAKAPLAFTRHPLPRSDPTRRQPDITRAREVLRWKPVVPLFPDGLRRTIEWAQGQLL